MIAVAELDGAIYNPAGLSIAAGLVLTVIAIFNTGSIDLGGHS